MLRRLAPSMLLLAGTPGLLLAQAGGTAHQQMRLFAYGMGSYVRPDLGGALRNGGGTVGGTLNAYSFKSMELGLDARAVFSHGRVSNQTFLGGGPRLQYNAGRFEPYAAFHFGYGKVNFQQVLSIPDYKSNTSLVTGIAGGLDYRLSRTWSLRAEVERQSWKFDRDNPRFHPLAISAGVRYQFHFRNPYGPE